MIEETKKDVKHRMEQAVENVRSELGKLRTGKASPAILDGIMINYYGTHYAASSGRQCQRTGTTAAGHSTLGPQPAE